MPAILLPLSQAASFMPSPWIYHSFHPLKCCESHEALAVARTALWGLRPCKRQQMSPDPAQALLLTQQTPFGHVSLRSISDMQCWAGREGSGSWPSSLGGNVFAWEALGAAACSLKPHAGALNKSARDCFKVCRNFFVARGACNKGVGEWKAGQHQLCIVMDINRLNQGICVIVGTLRVLEYQLKKENYQNAALDLDPALKPELIGTNLWIYWLQMMICFWLCRALLWRALQPWHIKSEGKGLNWHRENKFHVLMLAF